jgi:hypothetical protein
LPGEDFEIVVVNDSGKPLPPADWQRSNRVRQLQTNRRERSVARNTGAAGARGRYLHFLDDDDWLEPSALQHLWELARRSDAAWLYGNAQARDRQGNPLLQLHFRLPANCFLPVMAGEWIPLQTSLIDARVFFALSGFHPLLAGPEDIDLLRRVALQYEIASTDHIVANILFGADGSTTDWKRHTIQRRWAREAILGEPGAFSRLNSSLRQLPPSDISWHGQIARIYLTSMVWNLQRRRLWSAASRAAHATAAVAYSGSSVFSSAFWRALSRPYPNLTFTRGLAALGRNSS